ncbi:META domain-containing protein [Chitinophaga nivalis]|uniref:META domain-containing protein n=1 Tax=Chitinophaga nivalis TaxID=2991709 RepID=A0ABT3IVG8_9BACT|nr:META domain-containing protein [Chitinophaga nivalis]MCW3462313.1 META domain-containing protein [Chitinophaga nivalis]MCW3487996.1 META domain-containing protein [Chitinophaga nivalis]
MLFELAISFATSMMAPVQKQQPQQAKSQIIYVKESKEPCTGVAPMECLQIKGLKDAEWSNLYTNINGFNYVPGYRYKLRIRVTPVKNPPADGSSVKYTLTKVLEKKKINSSATNAPATQWEQLADKRWELVQLGNNAVTNSGIFLEFDTKDKRFSGKSGCNNIFGGYKATGKLVSFSQVASTLMACPDRDVMRREGEFNTIVSDHSFRYEVTGQTLRLYDAKGKVALVFNLTPKENKTAGKDAPDARQWAYIASKKWNLIQFDGKTLTESGVWLEFDPATKRFHGKGGCNNISGGYDATREQLTFSAAISTRMACPNPEVMQREAAFLQKISEHTFRYDVADQTLNLYENDKLVVMFGMQDK